MKATGGYLLTKCPLILTGGATHTSELDRPVSDIDLDAINRVQRTPWRINRWLYDVMAEAWLRELPLPGIVVGKPVPVPGKLPDEDWAALDADAKAEHIKRKREAHATNASIAGRTQALLDRLTVARELRDKERIWFPHARCFRGRIYPIPTAGPHPQGDDVAKALLMFAEGVPLGPDGLFWLCVRAANAFGHDKLPLEERVEWALSNLEKMHRSVSDPASCEWWTQADEPWSFLSTCLEITHATSLRSPSPEEFVSHLAIPLDGSCNGLQHLSAMGLDPVGARATNLEPGPRQDIYEEVAKRVAAAVEEDAAAGCLEALDWHGRVNRKVVKRAVMTTPYGVTERGIRRQLVVDGLVPGQVVATSASADYLGDKLVAALSETIQGGKAIMAWLQTTAYRLAEAGIPFDWTTPTGSKCRQAYWAVSRRRVATLVGQVTLTEEMVGRGTLTPRKQALGSAPNFIHSFDAAHLALTVNACWEEGVRDFAMVHDSFGVHAGHTTRLSRVLREQFVGIYKEDWLARTAEEIRGYAPHVELPPLPGRGEFAIERVLDAPFFFS